MNGLTDAQWRGSEAASNWWDAIWMLLSSTALTALFTRASFLGTNHPPLLLLSSLFITPSSHQARFFGLSFSQSKLHTKFFSWFLLKSFPPFLALTFPQRTPPSHHCDLIRVNGRQPPSNCQLATARPDDSPLSPISRLFSDFAITATHHRCSHDSVYESAPGGAVRILPCHAILSLVFGLPDEKTV